MSAFEVVVAVAAALVLLALVLVVRRNAKDLRKQA
jgi:hypothetical protein